MRIVAIKDGIVMACVAVDQTTKFGTRSYYEGQGYIVLDNEPAAVGDSYIDGVIVPKSQNEAQG